MWVWPNSYFRLIYIHALFTRRRCSSSSTGNSCSAANDRKSIRLLHKMKEQEHWYAFSNISYNFLPQLIYRAIDTGLDIATEREQLHRHLEQEAERLEKNSERRLAGPYPLPDDADRLLGDLRRRVAGQGLFRLGKRHDPVPDFRRAPALRNRDHKHLRLALPAQQILIGDGTEYPIRPKRFFTS